MLFQSVYDALYSRQMREDRFHNDESGWKVLESVEGKVGNRWWLWVSRSDSVTYFQIAPSRGADIPIEHFKNILHLKIIVICDRYSAYKSLAKQLAFVILAFCWAHVRSDGLIQLPASNRKKHPVRTIEITSATDPQTSVICPVHQLPPLQLQLVIQATSSLWNEYIERYHYLGHKPLPGAQLRYFITAGKDIVALAGFGAAAWQTAPRDLFVGWTHEQRKRNLHLIVNNARFLILPWIQSKKLASKTLSLLSRQLPDDWENRYNIRPVLLESFVQKIVLPGLVIKRQIGHT